MICPVKSVRDLGVHLDSQLTTKTHIESSQLHRFAEFARFVGQDVAQQLVSAFILSRLDYCNSLLSRLLVNYSASASCDECSVSSHNEFVAARPCATSVEAATLAAGWAKNCMQAVSVYAPHPHRTSTKIPVRLRLCIHSFCSQRQIPAEVYWLSVYVLRRTRTTWRTWLLLLRSIRLEHTSVRPSRHYWYQYIQKTTQECTFGWCIVDYCWRSCTCRIAAPYISRVDWLIKFE